MYDVGLEEQAELVFREQADGRKVARLPTGKIALIHYDSVDAVKDGERWLVNLMHRDTYAVAEPLHKTREAVRAGSATRPRVSTTRLVPPTTDNLPFERSVEVQEPAPAPEPVVEAPDVEERAEAVEPQPAVRAAPSATAGAATAIAETDRVAFFVDAANTDSACRDAGYFVDFRKAVRHFLGRGVFYAAYYYVADFTIDRDSKQVSFLDYLNYAGYVVRLKKVKRIVDRETGNEIFKANVDTEIVVDMLNTAENYDVAFLFSGDSDFERLVDILRSRGKRVYIVSSRNTLSRELSYVADKPVTFLEDHRDALVREQ